MPALDSLFKCANLCLSYAFFHTIILNFTLLDTVNFIQFLTSFQSLFCNFRLISILSNILRAIYISISTITTIKKPNLLISAIVFLQSYPLLHNFFKNHINILILWFRIFFSLQFSNKILLSKYPGLNLYFKFLISILQAIYYG